MAHFVKLNAENYVIFVTVARDEDDNREIEISQETGEIYKRTSYNTHGGIHYQADNNTPSQDQSKAFRKNYAGIGYYYDSIRDAFIPPKPFPSWILDEFSCLWQSPIPYPNDGKMYTWNEETTSWVEVVIPTGE
jgi:hypothetical protein